MFAQKIESIEAQIEQLQQQQAKYQTLQGETLNALALITQIRQQAAELGESEAIAIAFLEALQIQPNSEVPTTVETESHTEIEEDSPEEGEDNEWVEETTLDEKYSTPSELAAALGNDDPETVLMEIANVLDSTPATEIEGKVWYFVQNLPVELGDRIISYLPKSIVPEWRKQMDVLAEEAKASIFPSEQPTITYEPAIDDVVECLSNGTVGRITYICDAPEGKRATVLVPGGASNFHVSNLKYIGKFEGEKPEDAPNPKHASTEPASSDSDEIDQLARQCLALRSWSQMRIFADSNPAVITRMQEIASTKAESRVINNLPSLVIGYIERANDRTDLEWLPDPVLSEVEALLAQPQPQAIALKQIRRSNLV